MNRHKINLLIIFLIALSFYAYFVRIADANINSRLGLVKAVVEERHLTIDSYHNGEFETSDKAYVNGHYYSDKAIGAALLGALIYAPMYGFMGHPLSTDLFIMLLTGVAISLPCALLAPLLYSLALRVVKAKWIALSIALSIALGTQFFPYSSAFYGHSLAAILAFSVFYLWMEVNQFNIPITASRLFLSGFLIGFLVLTEYPTLIIALLLIGYVIGVIRSRQKNWDWKKIGLFLAGGAIPLVILLSYNWICFGSPFVVGYANESVTEFRNLHSEGLMGIGLPNLETLLYMTVNPMMGIFIQAPVLLLAIGGFVVMQREKKLRLELIVSTLIILVYLLAISGLKLWWGGDAFTVRHLIPILPFFAVFLMYLPNKYAPLLVGVGLLSFFQMLIAVETVYHPLDDIIRDRLAHGFAASWKTSLLYQELLPKLLRNKLVFTWGHYLFGVNSWYMNLIVPIIAAFVLLVIFYFVNRRGDEAAAYPDSFQMAKKTEAE